MGAVTSRDLLGQVDDLPHHEMVRLVMAATGLSRSEVLADREIAESEASAINTMVTARRAGEPLQYLEGTIPFGSADVAVDHRALIPRPETEQLLELASTAVPEPRVVVDIGTGTGCLAIALKLAAPDARVIGTDISPMALSLAHENAQRNAVDIEFHVGNLFEAVPRQIAGTIDLLVSNPPYVSSAEMAELPSEVQEWEPELALHGGFDGLMVIRPLIASLPQWLAPKGVALIEVGEGHVDEAAELAIPVFERVELLRDLAGRRRFLKITFGGRRFEVAGGG